MGCLEASAQTVDTVAAARALVPLLGGVQERLRPRVGIVPGQPQPSPFTGTVTTLVSIGIGKKDVTIDARVLEAMNRLQRWNPENKAQSNEAVLFDHWLTQLTVKAAHVGLLNCDASCVVQRFTKPDEAFGPSPKEREERRDHLVLEALADAVEELEQ
jgi:hypothetical protein